MARIPAPESAALYELVVEYLRDNPDTIVNFKTMQPTFGEDTSPATTVLQRMFNATLNEQMGMRLERNSILRQQMAKLPPGVLYRTKVGSYVLDTDARIIRTGISKNKWPIYLGPGKVIPPKLHVPDAIEAGIEATDFSAPEPVVARVIELPTPEIELIAREGSLLVLRLDGVVTIAHISEVA